MAQVLVVDDEAGFRTYVVEILSMEGHSVAEAGDGESALEVLGRRAFDLVVVDLAMPRLHGMEVVRHLSATQPEVEVIVWTAHGSIAEAVEAVKLGAFDFLQKPPESPEQLRLVVGRALERRRLRALEEEARDRRGNEDATPLTYGDPAMVPVVRMVEKVAPTDATVLLLGESGTGKEVAARTIHRLSQRSEGPFCVVNCASLPEELIESELFGHEKGAFTGAVNRRRGHIELAQGGTFFLDEIGELSPKVQAKLLRVLQDGTFQRVGGTQQFQADVRWIAATNRDLESMMREGTFREDLYHRLALLPVQLPPLRERRADILPLAETLLARISAKSGRPRKLDADAETAIRQAPWRGNIRELANALERASILSDTERIGCDDLLLDPPAEAAPSTGEPEAYSLEAAEREALMTALERCGGSRRQAARMLGIGERTLYTKLNRYGVR